MCDYSLHSVRTRRHRLLEFQIEKAHERQAVADQRCRRRAARLPSDDAVASPARSDRA